MPRIEHGTTTTNALSVTDLLADLLTDLADLLADCITTTATTLLLGGPPIGYFNWNMLLNQAMVQGIESAVLFGGVYLALEYALDKGWISKFE